MKASRVARGANGLVASCMAIALLACHSDSYVIAAIPPLGPAGTADDVQLTFNPARDYWPTWSEDGKSILYQFGQPGRRDDDRCLGLLPAEGGTQIWTLCDDRVSQADSSNSFSAFALGSDGRLLYLEAVGRVGTASGHVTQIRPDHTVLWLADTAHPFLRRALVTMPQVVGDSSIDWLADATWVGQNEFIAIGAVFEPTPPDPQARVDTAFYGLLLVRGTIGATGASLAPIAGTDGASGYALAQHNTSVIVSRRDSRVLTRVPLGGGTPTVITTLPATIGSSVLGLSCREDQCIVATGTTPIAFRQRGTGARGNSTGSASRQVLGGLWQVALNTGSASILTTPLLANGPLWATPRLAPGSRNVIMQVGGSPGVLQLYFSVGVSDLHLFKSLFPGP